MTEVMYKWLDGDQSGNGGNGRWQKNRWRSVKGDLVPCRNGLHLCRPQDLPIWILVDLWVAEYDGELIEETDKVVVRRARVVERLVWNDRVARLFAADCAERVLPLFEAQCPGDDRPRLAIQAARAYANGEIDAAAWAAARAAAWAAARYAARAAARAAAWDAAWAAARDAAWDAARATARAAARDAARDWQGQRILDYAHGRAQ